MAECAKVTEVSSVKSIAEIISSLPQRVGKRPRTTPTNPHQQISQNGSRRFQETVFERARNLPGVEVKSSLLSVPGARALSLEDACAGGPAQAFMAGQEFAHLHPPYDGSLHMTLPPGAVEEVVAQGWGEMHPVARMGLIPPTALMVYGPRDEEELEVVWQILQASYLFARGESERELNSELNSEERSPAR
ncbi:MAG: DUF5519 family protein [Chloroflexota bacterium]|nr:DUF5519 family protein [Chloroflexota bacterium]